MLTKSGKLVYWLGMSRWPHRSTILYKWSLLLLLITKTFPHTVSSPCVYIYPVFRRRRYIPGRCNFSIFRLRKVLACVRLKNSKDHYTIATTDSARTISPQILQTSLNSLENLGWVLFASTNLGFKLYSHIFYSSFKLFRIGLALSLKPGLGCFFFLLQSYVLSYIIRRRNAMGSYAPVLIFIICWMPTISLCFLLLLFKQELQRHHFPPHLVGATVSHAIMGLWVLMVQLPLYQVSVPTSRFFVLHPNAFALMTSMSTLFPISFPTCLPDFAGSCVVGFYL